MSKKATNTIPDRYKNLPVLTKSLGELGITRDTSGNFFKWDRACPIASDGVAFRCPNYTVFHDNAEAFPIEKLRELHVELFKEQAADTMSRASLTEMLYRKMLMVATDRTHAATAAPTDPVSGRKSTISTRTYTVLPKPEGVLIKTPQANTCYKIALESAVDGKITEADLKLKINERAAEIKTKQDPWRIFQYYRPTLIAQGLIKHD